MSDVVATTPDQPLATTVDADATITVLLSILDGIAGYTFNPDAWWLAYHDAKRQCLALGIPEEHFDAVKDRFQAFRRAKKERNPLSSLHEPG